MFKRIISLILCMLMFLSALPAQVLAMDTDAVNGEVASETEPAAETTQPTETVAESAEQEPETEQETVEETAETVPDLQPENDSGEQEITEYIDGPAYDEDELYEGYLNRLFFGEESAAFGVLARERLSASSKYAYDKLKGAILQIADGQRSSTQVEIRFSEANLSFDLDEWEMLVDALVHDCPYEMYWYGGCRISYTTNLTRCTFKLQPRANYKPSGFNMDSPTINVTKAGQAATAAANARSILAQYASYDDYDKLAAYADKICALVEYDHYAADNDISNSNISPWTLVNVFDNDPTTNVVCEGYAEAFQYLCDLSDFDKAIECYSVRGANHEWNIVRINGISYLMDVTHCDNAPGGNVALRGSKFLGGAYGSIAAGYHIGGTHYWYYKETTDLWGTGSDSILNLSPTKYAPPVTVAYSVTYDANGGTKAPQSQTKDHGISLTLENAIPGRVGYNFGGWATSADAVTASYQPGDTYSANADITLYAVWNQPQVLNGRMPEYVCSAEINYPGTGVYFVFQPDESGYYRAYSTLEKDTRVFLYDSSGRLIANNDDGNGNLQFRLDFAYDRNALFYLYVDFYQSITGRLDFTVSRGLEITYDSNGGTGAPESDFQYYGFDIILSTRIPEKAGYTFLGWSEDPHDTEVQYAPGDPFVTDSDITLYAVWRSAACAHSFGDYSVIKPATCVEDGVEERVCALCGETETRSIPAGHTVENCVCIICGIYGTCGDDLTWAFEESSGILTISGSGAMDDYDDLNDRSPWYGLCDRIFGISVQPGVTAIGSHAFSYDYEIRGSLVLPQGLTRIGECAFTGCGFGGELVLPQSLTHIEDYAFAGCSGFTGKLTLPESLTIIGRSAFTACSGFTGDLVIPGGVTSVNAWSFTQCGGFDGRLVLPETLTQVDSYAFVGCCGLTGELVIPEGVTQIGERAFDCCCSLKEITFAGTAPVIADDAFLSVSVTAYYPAGDPTWTADVMQNYGGAITWLPVGGVENRLYLNGDLFSGMTTVWIDGVEYDVADDKGIRYVDLPDSKARVMTVYEYHQGDGSDVHIRYPVSMKVWTLTNTDGFYMSTRQEDFDDILQYSGASIRVAGKKGIRMITSMEQVKKDALTTAGLAGFTLKEYGTAVAWAHQLGDDPLILGAPSVRSNYAYRKGVADPVFDIKGGLMQYTNVLVGFSNLQCSQDIAMRPYMILQNAEGEEITLYGGIVCRSIGYIACQNRNVFTPGTEEYEYIWGIIHSVYGDFYDDDYIEV